MESVSFDIPCQFFTVYDDNIDEDEQSFAIVAEIIDVPNNVTCFQIGVGMTECLGYRGATRIRIIDNDGKCLVHLSIEISSFSFTAMVIGFTQRSMTVSESDAYEGEDFFPIDISVATQRTTEREHQMIFRLLPGSRAIVDSLYFLTLTSTDAIFGDRTVPDEPIEEHSDVNPLESTIPPLVVNIINDFRPEEEECFTIRILPVDIPIRPPHRRELFSCNSVGDNYFCETTICIADDDGRFARNI